MKHLHLTAFVLLAALAMLAAPAAWAHTGDIATPEATTVETTSADLVCDFEPVFEDGLETDEIELVCGCRDQCQDENDCILWCGEPAACVMNNPCCTECACESTF